MNTKEKMEKLLNEMKTKTNSRFDVDYYSKKEKNPYEWKVFFEGPKGSIYEGGFYMVKVVFDDKYPNTMPQPYFMNKIFHPHVEQSSLSCCIRPIKYDIYFVLDAVEWMFLDYDKGIDHAYNQTPKHYLLESKEKFIKEAKSWVTQFAKMKDIDQFYDL